MKTESFFRSCCFLVSVLAFTVSGLTGQEKGKIGAFDDEAKPSAKDTATVSPVQIPSSSSSSSETTSELSLDGIIVAADLTFHAVQFTVMAAGSIMIQAPGEDSAWYDNTFWTRGYTPYPYYRNREGLFSASSGKKFMLDASGEYFDDFDNLTGYGGTIRASFHPAFSFDGAVIDIKERLNTRTDHIRFYRFGVNYHRVRKEHAAVWWGVGIKGMSATTVHQSGLAFNLGAEIFPADPVSMKLEYSVGSINGKSLYELSTGIRCHLNRFALHAGYRLFGIGNADLSGLTLGVSMTY